MLLADALRALPLLERYEGTVVDVGSGGGSPGIPLAASLPEREVTLLEAERRKCDFLRRWAPPNAQVVRGRAEEQQTERWGVALAKALADRVAGQVRESGEPEELEPMTAVERKVVHLRLKDVVGVGTTSEGTEPNRYVVVVPE